MSPVNPHPRSWAEIDLTALAHNLGAIRRRLGPSPPEIALVAKADAYGHGLVPVARHALRHGADWAAVATVQEGIALRDAGVDSRIAVLSPILPVEAEQAVFYGFDILFEEEEVLKALGGAAVGMGRTANVHLKVDTGIHRFGCSPDSALALARAAMAQEGVELVGLAQHFADSSRDPVTTRHQLDAFQAVAATLRAEGIDPPVVHAANSAGTLTWPDSLFTMVRVGLAAYGIDPFGWLGGEARPVMAWWSRVTSVRSVARGQAVGYSGTAVLERDSVLATVGVGYGDGYPRALSNRAAMEVHGRLAPVVGLVCMDQTILDVTDCPPVAVGDSVRVIGGQASASSLAEAAQTNAHEIVTRLMSRVPRKYRF
jgi:alanine racemase